MNQLLKQYRIGTATLRFGLTCLLYVSVWQYGCAQIDPGLTTSAALTDPACRTITVSRVMPTTVAPAPIPQGLPTPVFSQQTGTLAYGTTVSITATGMPTNAFIEYSTDNGTSWVKGTSAPVVSKKPILARVRVNDLTSATATATVTPFFKRTMIIGNSIMSHAPAPNLGWTNTNGMAASAPDKDFVYLLTTNLKRLNSNMQVNLYSGGSFERYFGLPSYSVDEFVLPVQSFKPDLIVVRIGENVTEADVTARNFLGEYRQFLDKLASQAGGPVQIICSTSVWNRPKYDAVVRQVAAEKGYPVADMKSMVGVPSFFASQYANADVAAHPNDTGMQRIADILWDSLP
ncbi:GDSL-type esterase/lipase family protein [Spirosoma luteolum]